MKSYISDLSALQKGKPCIIVNELAPKMEFYFGEMVEEISDGDAEALRVEEGMHMSKTYQCYARPTSPIGINAQDGFTTIVGWTSTSSNFHSTERMKVIPDTPGNRVLIRGILRAQRQAAEKEAEIDRRTKLFSEILLELGKGLLLPAPVKSFLAKVSSSGKLDQVWEGLLRLTR